MNDERKGDLKAYLEVLFKKCIGKRAGTDFSESCQACGFKPGCEKFYKAILRLIQQKPEIDEAFIKTLAHKLWLQYRISVGVEDMVTQALSETRGLQEVPVVKIRPERMDHMDKGALIGKPRSGPEVDEVFIGKWSFHMTIAAIYDADDRKQKRKMSGPEKNPSVCKQIRRMLIKAGVKIKKGDK